MRGAYVTLLSSTNYLKAVIILSLSLKKVNSNFPLLVAITEDVVSDDIIQILSKLGCEIKVIERLEYSSITKERWKNNTVLNTASKLQIFSFYEWDKLVYLDCDSIILQNIDDLFTYLDGSMLYDANSNDGCTSMFVLEPKRHNETEFLFTIMQNHDCFDGDLLGKMWFHISSSKKHQIPANYFSYYLETLNYSLLDLQKKDIKAVHFCNHPKPWLEPNHKYYNDCYSIAKLYKDYLKQI